MNRYHLVHTTQFQYDGPVSESYNEVRLRPIQDDKQSCLSFRLTTTPPARITAHRDGFENWVHHFSILPEHRQLKVETETVVLSHDVAAQPPDPTTLQEFRGMRDEFAEDNFDFVAPSTYVPHLGELAAIADAAEARSGGTTEGFVATTSSLIHDQFRYVKGATHVHSSIKDCLALKAGVCQDFAHLLLGVARMRGLPARYVSGYLVPGSAESPTAAQEKVIGGYASHAWAEVCLPVNGWTSFDPTLGAPVGLRHIRVAYGRDYGDVAPVRGVYKGHAGQRLSVDVRVRPALDDEGHEQLSKVTSALPDAPALAERPQQPHQQ
jgi:transglutaminase-like putative cysteine protease